MGSTCHKNGELAVPSLAQVFVCEMQWPHSAKINYLGLLTFNIELITPSSMSTTTALAYEDSSLSKSCMMQLDGYLCAQVVSHLESGNRSVACPTVEQQWRFSPCVDILEKTTAALL